jgi:hypothetical protein
MLQWLMLVISAIGNRMLRLNQKIAVPQLLAILLFLWLLFDFAPDQKIDTLHYPAN